MEIPIFGDDKSLCQCNKPATREVLYERKHQGLVKTFREFICDNCLIDEEYFISKNIISITKI